MNYNMKIQNTELASGVSVIICSHNGAKKLAETIKHLMYQKVQNNIAWEIIYVDNASSDNSIDIVKSTWNQEINPTVPLHILREERAGKYFALFSGVQHANFEYFIICDDDNWLASNYVETVYNILSSDSNIGACGGISIPVFEKEDQVVPVWITRDFDRYALGAQGKTSGDITQRKQLWGAGMASKTNIYKQIYDAHPSIFLADENTGHFIAEDTEYCVRLVLRGFNLYFDDKLAIRHFVPDERLTEAYNKKLNERIHLASPTIEYYNFSTKIYGTLGANFFNRIRLRIITPIRYLFAKAAFKKKKHKTIFYLLYPSFFQKNPILEKIKSFVEDPNLPSGIYSKR